MEVVVEDDEDVDVELEVELGVTDLVNDEVEEEVFV